MKTNGNSYVKLKTLLTILFFVLSGVGGVFGFIGSHVVANEKDRVKEDKEIRTLFYEEVQEIRKEQAVLKDSVQDKFDNVQITSTQILVELGKLQEQIRGHNGE